MNKNYFNLIFSLAALLTVVLACTNPRRTKGPERTDARAANNAQTAATPKATPTATPTAQPTIAPTRTPIFVETASPTPVPKVPKNTRETKESDLTVVEDEPSTARRSRNTGRSSRKSATSAGSFYITGPRGGCYYWNSNGKKTYVDHSYCGG
jgi:hypothetical protein